MSGLGPVVYEPPLTRSSPHWTDRGKRILTTGPRWLRGATRWHRVRSAVQYPHQDGPVYHLWCGQTRFDRDRPQRTDVPPVDEAPLCATCEGRAAGAGHASPLRGAALLFSPDRLIPPRWCPGGKYSRIHEEVGRRVLRCGACSEIVAERNASYWHNHQGQPRQHEPGPGLVPGCPMHAWRHLVRTAEGVACECAGLENAS